MMIWRDVTAFLHVYIMYIYYVYILCVHVCVSLHFFLVDVNILLMHVLV